MTAEPRRLRMPAAPEEGWLTLVLVGVMAYLMAAAIDEAGWVLGGGHLTDFLVIATLLGVAAGFLGSKIGWNRWIANLVGAIFAALIVPVLVGQVLEPGQSIGFQYAATADQSLQAWTDLIVLRLQATRAIGHHLLILGLLCWGTGQFAASAVFRHHRPLSAVVVIGAILVANMAASLHEQEIFLVLFSVAALFLLTRLHALDEQATWAQAADRRPERRPRHLPARRGGLHPRRRPRVDDADRDRQVPAARRGLGRPEAVAPRCQRFHPAIPADARGKPRDRRRPVRPAGPDPRILDRPTAASRSRSGATRPTTSPSTGGPSPTTSTTTSAGSGRAAPTRRRSRARRVPSSSRAPRTASCRPGTKDLTFQVTPDDLRGSYIVSPLAPLSIDRDSELLGAGDEAFFQAVQINGREPYSVTARVPLRGDDGGGVTANKLRAAGQGYPPEIVGRYTQLPADAVGPAAQAVLDDVLLKLKANNVVENPYDLSLALVTSSSHVASSTTRTSPSCSLSAITRAWRSASRRSAKATASTTRR